MNNVTERAYILPTDVAPPCKAACPVRTDAQRYVALIAQQRYQEALEVIMENNPFPGSIGRICVHPCEDNCRRGQVEGPIAICALKRFVADQVGDKFQPQGVPKTKDKNVAVIGSGPAGLTAAHNLARQGYEVTIFEKQPHAGGMLRYGILNYRLPKDVLEKDIQNILAVGIELKTETAVGEDLSFLELRESYDAVLIAVGLSTSKSIPLPGADLDGVHYAIPFLEAINYGRPEQLGDDVIVVGGGNVAVDVARTARRLGSKLVKMVCLEARDEMPAHDWEIAEAMAEGVEIHCSFGPHQIVGEDGRVSALEFKEVDCVFDEHGRFNPKFHEDRRSTLSADTVIFAIGQGSELSFLKDSGVALNERGQLVFDRRTMATSLPGVFATGEVATGPGAAISAIASGHRAARAVLSYLESGHILPLAEDGLSPIAELPKTTRGLIKTTPRQKMPAIEAEKRIDNFDEVELGFTVEAAVREAQRCLSCGAGAIVDPNKCVACLACVRVCPYNVPVIEGAVAYMDPTTCQSCGICAAECPAQAITVRLTEEQNIASRIAKTKAKVIGFVCQYGQMWASERLWKLEGKLPEGAEIIDIMCLGRLSANYLLAALEQGADKVFVMPCVAGKCHNTSGNTLAEQKVGYVLELLASAGLDSEMLQLVPLGFGTSIIGTLKEV